MPPTDQILGKSRMRIDARERKVAATAGGEGAEVLDDFMQRRFFADPVGYCRYVLNVQPTPDQEAILNGLITPPCKVLVPSGNSCGKSFIAGAAINWSFDCRGPSVTLSTGPTAKQVNEVLWTEVRLQRARANLPDYFIGPKAPDLWRSHDWLATGFTTNTPEGFQGRHRDRTLFVMDEATAIPPEFWHRMRTMFDPRPESHHAILAIFNPLTTNCQAYIEDQLVDDDPKNPPWTRIRLSCLNHPNVLAELRGEPPPIPGAVNKAMVDGWVRDWCEPVDRIEDVLATDISWPPGSGRYFRPGSNFQSSCLGLWPSDTDAIWSDAAWTACERRLGNGKPDPLPWPTDSTVPIIGCDTAQGKGQDWHAIHSRWGLRSFAHETANTMNATRIAQRLREAAAKVAKFVTNRRARTAAPFNPKHVIINIDDDGTGGAIVAMLQAEGYTIRGIGAACSAMRPDRYPNRRSEMWFQGAAKAARGLIDVSSLDSMTRKRLKQQLMIPAFKTDGRGRRCVQPKEQIRELLGRSPDDADAFLLAWADQAVSSMRAIEPEPDEAEPRREGHYAKGRERERRWA